MTTPNTETGQTGRVNEADVLRFGLDRNAAHAERLAKENRELREEIRMLEEVIRGLKRGEFICCRCGLRKDDEHEKGDF